MMVMGSIASTARPSQTVVPAVCDSGQFKLGVMQAHQAASAVCVIQHETILGVEQHNSQRQLSQLI